MVVERGQDSCVERFSNVDEQSAIARPGRSWKRTAVVIGPATMMNYNRGQTYQPMIAQGEPSIMNSDRDVDRSSNTISMEHN